MPGCAWPDPVCRLRPQRFVMGAACGDGTQGMVFAAACPLHVDEIAQHVANLSPLGSWSMAYEAQAFRIVMEEAEAEGPTWELRLRMAEAG